MDTAERHLGQLQAAAASHNEQEMVSVCEELCTLLCIGNDEVVQAFDAQACCKVLAQILRMEGLQAPELKVFAMRGVALLLDVNSRSAPVAVAKDVISLSLGLLGAVDTSVQLCEELLKALESLSLDFPHSIIEAGGLVALLSSVSGLEVTKERLHHKVITIVTNICSRLTIADWGDVECALPILVSVLKEAAARQVQSLAARHEVDAVVSKVCLAFAHLVDRLGSSEVHFAAVTGGGLLGALLRFFEPFPPPESARTALRSAAGDDSIWAQLGSLPPPSSSQRVGQQQCSFILKVLGIIFAANPQGGARLFARHGVFQQVCGMLCATACTATADTVAQLPARGGGEGEAQGGDPSPLFRDEAAIRGTLDFLSLLLPPLTPNSVLEPDALIPFHPWKWEDDYRHLADYDEIICHKLEAEYTRQRQRQQLRSCEVVLSGQTYQLNFTQMQQTRRGARRARAIYRDSIPSHYVRYNPHSRRRREAQQSQQSAPQGAAAAAGDAQRWSRGGGAAAAARPGAPPAPVRGWAAPADGGAGGQGAAQRPRGAHADPSSPVAAAADGDGPACTACLPAVGNLRRRCTAGLSTAAAALRRRVSNASASTDAGSDCADPDLSQSVVSPVPGPSGDGVVVDGSSAEDIGGVRDDILVVTRAAEAHWAHAPPALLRQLLLYVIPSLTHVMQETVSPHILGDGVCILARVLGSYARFTERAARGERAERDDDPRSGERRGSSGSRRSSTSQGRTVPLAAHAEELQVLLAASAQRLSRLLVALTAQGAAFAPFGGPPPDCGKSQSEHTPCSAAPSVYGDILAGALLCIDCLARLLPDVYLVPLQRHGVVAALAKAAALPQALGARGQTLSCNCRADPAASPQRRGADDDTLRGLADPVPQGLQQQQQQQQGPYICAARRLGRLAAFARGVAARHFGSRSVSGEGGSAVPRLPLTESPEVAETLRLLNVVADRWADTPRDEATAPPGGQFLVDVDELLTTRGITPHELAHPDGTLLPALVDCVAAARRAAARTDSPCLELYFPTALWRVTRALLRCSSQCLLPSAPEPPPPAPVRHGRHGDGSGRDDLAPPPPAVLASVPLSVPLPAATFATALINAMAERAGRPLSLKCVPLSRSRQPGATAEDLADEHQSCTVTAYPFVTFAVLEHSLSMRTGAHEPLTASGRRRSEGRLGQSLHEAVQEHASLLREREERQRPQGGAAQPQLPLDFLSVRGGGRGARAGAGEGASSHVAQVGSGGSEAGLSHLLGAATEAASQRSQGLRLQDEDALSSATGFTAGDLSTARSPTSAAAGATGVAAAAPSVASALDDDWGNPAREARRHPGSGAAAAAGAAPSSPPSPPPPVSAIADFTGRPGMSSFSIADSEMDGGPLSPPGQQGDAASGNRGADPAWRPPLPLARAQRELGRADLQQRRPQSAPPVAAAAAESSSVGDGWPHRPLGEHAPSVDSSSGHGGHSQPQQQDADGDDGASWGDGEPPRALEFSVDGHVVPCRRMTILDAVVLYSHSAAPLRRLIVMCGGAEPGKDGPGSRGCAPHAVRAAVGKALALWGCSVVIHFRRLPHAAGSAVASPSTTAAPEPAEAAAAAAPAAPAPSPMSAVASPGSPLPVPPPLGPLPPLGRSRTFSPPAAPAGAAPPAPPPPPPQRCCSSDFLLGHSSVAAHFQGLSRCDMPSQRHKPAGGAGDSGELRQAGHEAPRTADLLLPVLHDALQASADDEKQRVLRALAPGGTPDELWPLLGVYSHRLCSALLHDLREGAVCHAFPSLGPLVDHPNDERRLARKLLWLYPSLFPLALRIRSFDALVSGCRLAVLRAVVPPPGLGGVSGSSSGWLIPLRSVLGNTWIRAPGSQWGAAQVRKHKCTVDRRVLLRCADQIFARYASSPLPLDVSFDHEPGTGQGPTAEFYTLVGRALQRSELRLWRSDGCGPIVDAPHGLFPQVLNPRATARERAHILRLWSLVGRYLGRALHEGRTVDMHFSPLFYELLLGHDICADAAASMALLDPQYERSLRRLEHLSEHPDAQAKEAIAGLGLDFTLPGCDGVELVPDGASIAVTADNICAYADFVRAFILSRGIEAPLQALYDGLSEVFPLHYLSLFSASELRGLLCGEGDEHEPVWSSPEALERDIVCDHGYSRDSPPVRALISAVAAFEPQQQRAFLNFLSGSPRMPLGGLHPKITVVRRDMPAVLSDAMSSTDAEEAAREVPLPSVNTCFHYLKLPPYPTERLLRAKLLVAMTDGQGSFDLS